MVISFTVGWLLGSYLIGTAMAYTFICMANWDDNDLDGVGGKGQFAVAVLLHSLLWPLTLTINICSAIIEQRKELFKRDVRLIVCAVIGENIPMLGGRYGLSDPDVERMNRRLKRLDLKYRDQFISAVS